MPWPATLQSKSRQKRHCGRAKNVISSVITAMRDGVVLFAADGNILACNASAERILGLSAEQIIGRSARDPRWRAIRKDGSPFPEDEFPCSRHASNG